MKKSKFLPTIVLGCICLVVALLLSLVNSITGPIIEAAQNEYLNKFLLELFNKSAIFLTFYDSSPNNLDSIHTHEQLLAAIKEKDMDAAVKALEADLVCAVDCISLQ